MTQTGSENTAKPLMAHLFSTFATGGAQRRFVTLAAHLPEWRHLICAMDDNFDAASLLPPEVSAQTLPLALEKSGGISGANLSAIREKIFGQAPALFCTYNWGAMEGVFANRRLPLPGLRVPHIHFEDGFGADETATRQIARRALTRAAALRGVSLVVPSRSLQGVARRHWHLSGPNVRYLPNGIDASHFTPAPEPAAGIIGTVGALRPEKNYARLIRAFAQSGSGRLQITGEGAERPALERLGEALGLGARLRFTGAAVDPAQLYRQMQVFALSSDTEQMPLTVLEAMACGLPIVATDVGDIAQMVSDENRPFIFPLTEEAAYAQGLKTLLADPALSRRIGAANRERAVQKFSVGTMVSAYRTLFSEIAGFNPCKPSK